MSSCVCVSSAARYCNIHFPLFCFLLPPFYFAHQQTTSLRRLAPFFILFFTTPSFASVASIESEKLLFLLTCTAHKEQVSSFESPPPSPFCLGHILLPFLSTTTTITENVYNIIIERAGFPIYCRIRVYGVYGWCGVSCACVDPSLLTVYSV